MGKALVAYFSATGNTKQVASKLSKVVDGNLHEIVPKVAYTADDLNWKDKESRSSKEMNDKSHRPEISDQVDNMDSYDTIYLGYPIWWGVAPTIINTFLEKYDLDGKSIITFATSGSSEMGDSTEGLKISAKGTYFKEGKILKKDISEEELKSFVESLNK